MMSRYRLLLKISLRHEYFRNGRPDGFAITPSSATSTLLASTGLLLKSGQDSLLVLTRVDDQERPASPVPADAKFTFFLEPVGPKLLAVTNVDPDRLRSRRFYFSNLGGNATGEGASAVLNLSRRIADFRDSELYLPGEMAASGGSNFECIRTVRGTAPAPDSESWVSREGTQTVSQDDMLPLLPQRSGFRLRTRADAFRIQVFGLDPASNRLTRLVREAVVTTGPGNETEHVAANLEGLPPGRYRVNINGEDFEAYIDDEAKSRSAFAVIEIFNHLPGADDFSLIRQDGTVRGTAFTIRFANRRAHWKYHNPGQLFDNIRINSESDEPGPFSPGSNDLEEPERRDYFLSKVPLPLSDSQAENRFELMIGETPYTAPKPDPGIPGMITRSFDAATSSYRDYICNVHLNLFNVNQGR